MVFHPLNLLLAIIYFLFRGKVYPSSRQRDRIGLPNTAMFRRMRLTEPDKLSIRLSKILQPLTVIPWGALAMWHLGVPIAVGVMCTFDTKI